MSPPRPGFIHPSAVIGSPPEHRDWQEGAPLFEPAIMPSAQVNACVTIDAGREKPTWIGYRTFIMAHGHIGHDCFVGDDCEFAAGVVLAGHVTVGNRVRIGVNACVRPFITIGDGARIGAGAVVVKDVPAGEVWAGNPARKLGKEPELLLSSPVDEIPPEERETWDEWWNAREHDKEIIETPEEPEAA